MFDHLKPITVFTSIQMLVLIFMSCGFISRFGGRKMLSSQPLGRGVVIAGMKSIIGKLLLACFNKWQNRYFRVVIVISMGFFFFFGCVCVYPCMCQSKYIRAISKSLRRNFSGFALPWSQCSLMFSCGRDFFLARLWCILFFVYVQVCEQCPNVKYEREGDFITVDIEKGMQDGQVGIYLLGFFLMLPSRSN